ncbi:MAG: GHKL domain-containing protein [Lachnospiraceae bacterium]|nr:GHKL domain-containing protein [Lachnospiraceae bacterium]
MDWFVRHYMLFRMILAYVGAALAFTAPIRKRSHFALRFIACQGVFLAFISIRRISPGSLDTLAGNVVSMLAGLVLLILMIWFCVDCDFFQALGLSASASAARKIYLDVVAIMDQGLGRVAIEEPGHSLYSLSVMLAVYLICYFCFGSRAQTVMSAKAKWKNVVLGCSVLLLVGICRAIEFAYFDGARNLDWPLYCYDIVCLSICLIMQYILFENDILQEERQKIRQALQMKADYYEVSRENIALINTKCHDMRHQLCYLSPSTESGERYRQQIEEIINVYDGIVKTENEALNVVLTEKSLLCGKRHIRISCMADGEALAFLDDIDIYSLFGNLLDNAIESVEKLTDPEKRVIDLSVTRKNGFVFIQVMNYFEGELQFDGGFPVTQKENKDYHGYGLRSIQLIADKYHGKMNIEPKDQLFVVNLLFPVSAA